MSTPIKVEGTVYKSPLNGDHTTYQKIFTRTEIDQKPTRLRGYLVYDFNEHYTLYRHKKVDKGIIVMENK